MRSHPLRETWLFIPAAWDCARGFTWGSTATTKRAVVLRRDPSKSPPSLPLPPKAIRLMLVQLTADSGFLYHVKQSMTRSAGLGRLCEPSRLLRHHQTPIRLTARHRF